MTPYFRPPADDDLFEQVRAELFTAVVGDVMDAAGLTNQFLPPHDPLLEAGYGRCRWGHDSA